MDFFLLESTPHSEEFTNIHDWLTEPIIEMLSHLKTYYLFITLFTLSDVWFIRTSETPATDEELPADNIGPHDQVVLVSGDEGGHCNPALVQQLDTNVLHIPQHKWPVTLVSSQLALQSEIISLIKSFIKIN